jgi:VanZ family protein
VSLWGPVLLVAAGIGTLSHLSRPPGPSTVPDWLLHGAEFAVLGLFLARALTGGLRRPMDGLVVFWTLVLGIGYGIADEIHQWFVPLRDVSLNDVVADAVGTTAGLAAAALISRRLTREKAGERHPATGLSARARRST